MIFFNEGNPLDSDDLQKAGVEKSHMVLILKSTHESQEDSEPDTDALRIEVEATADRDALLIFRLIHRIYPTIRVIIEVVFIHNNKYLPLSHQESLAIEESPFFASHYASGAVYNSCFLHPIFSQAVFNPYAVAILDKIVLTQKSETDHSNMFLVAIPKSFKGKFEELFSVMLEDYKAIVIGLYRNKSLLPYGDVQGYVLCNPPPDMEVTTLDSMYIFGSFSNFDGTELQDLSNQVKEHKRRRNSFLIKSQKLKLQM